MPTTLSWSENPSKRNSSKILHDVCLLFYAQYFLLQKIIKVESTNQTFEYWHAWDFHSFDVTRQNDKLKGGHWLLATTRLGPQTGERSSPTSSVQGMGQSLVEWNHIPSTWIIGSLHPQKFNIAPEKWWLEDCFPIGKVTFQGLC